MQNLIGLSDQELIHFFKNGNSRAFDTLVYRYKSKVFTSISLFVKDKYAAEDIFQETFIKVIDRLQRNKYTDEGKFLCWLLRVARNLCIDHFRRKKNMPTLKSFEDTDIFSTLRLSEPGADQRITKQQTQDRVRKLIDQLPDEQRDVVILRHYANLSFSEISTIVNCNINTALGRMRYALLNLRRIIKENEMVM
jgi:RNA polymerase sigma factor (sigma-70 family)